MLKLERNRIRLTIALFLSLSSAAYAQDVQTDVIATRLSGIVDRHPAIEKQALLASARRNAARNILFGYPDPSIEISRGRGKEDMVALGAEELDASRTRIRMNELRISQPIPFPGKGIVAYNAMNAEVRKEELMLLIERNRLAGEILFTSLEYHAAKKVLEQNRTFLRKMESLQMTTSAKYETGVGSLTDVTRTRVRVNNLRLKVNDSEDQAQKLYQVLQYLLTPLNGERRMFTQPEIDRYLTTVRAHIPGEETALKERSLEIALARATASGKNHEDTLARMQYLPDVELFSALTDQDRRSATFRAISKERVYSAGIMIRVPVWSALTNHWNVGEKSDTYLSAEAGTRDTVSRLTYEAEATRNSLQLLDRGIQLHTEQIIPGAQMAFETALSSYQTAKGDYQSVLEGVELLYEHQIERIMHTLDRDRALIRLGTMYDVLLEKRKQD
ncbi:MAG: TolC family protein [Leptospirales bacterium]|nr:TolC family protein [Leptospirales bacterium]